MNAQQLKNSILQEAIEGRLVPQDPNDEPASVLLDKIRKEKARLVKEGKLNKKDLEEILILDDEIPFKVPESWEWVKLYQISLDSADGPFGSNLKREHYTTKKEVRIIQLSNIGEEGWRDDNEKYTTFSHLSSISRSEAFPDDIIIAKMMPAGRAIICPYGDIKYVLSSDAVRFDFSKQLYRKYLYYAINSQVFKDQVYSEVQGITRVRTSLSKLRTYLIPLPPLAEQQRIVAKIEELLPKVEEYGKAQEALDKLNKDIPDKLKKSILQEAIEGRLVPQDPNDEPVSVLLDKIHKEKARLVKERKLNKKELEDIPIEGDELPFEIPDSWVWCRMQDVIDFINGRAYKKEELLDKGKYKVLRVGNFFTNESWYFSNMELPDEKYCYKDDLLYAWSASFGPKIWDGDKTIFHYHIWNVKYNKDVLYRDYLYYFFLIDKEKIKNATTGSTMIHVSMENMKPRLIPIPPLEEQHRIVAKIEQLFSEIEKLKV